MTLCAPWLDAGDVTLCPADPSDTDAVARLNRALEVASWLLYRATGQVFTGLCTDVIRPCNAASAGQWLAYPDNVGGARPLPYSAGCGCGGSLDCGCTRHSAVHLPGQPVSQVLDVKVDGVSLTAGTDYVLVDDGTLVRAGGRSWPCCQRLDLPDSAQGTFSVTYTYGLLPTPDGLLAAEALACELVKGWCPDGDCGDCRLPKRITQLTYEGASMATFDPMQFLDQGRFGIAEVDYFVAQVNPTGDRRPGAVRTARQYLALPHRVRSGAPPSP